MGPVERHRRQAAAMRRGWCEAKDIANTHHVEEFQKLIER